MLDYKTDKADRGEELAEKYQEQLRYYAKALEQMTGKKVKEKDYIFIYFEERNLYKITKRSISQVGVCFFCVMYLEESASVI